MLSAQLPAEGAGSEEPLGSAEGLPVEELSLDEEIVESPPFPAGAG